MYICCMCCISDKILAVSWTFPDGLTTNSEMAGLGGPGVVGEVGRLGGIVTVDIGQPPAVASLVQQQTTATRSRHLSGSVESILANCGLLDSETPTGACAIYGSVEMPCDTNIFKDRSTQQQYKTIP